MEEPQLDVEVTKRFYQPELRAIERPMSGDEAAILVAVRVPEHHLLPAAARLEPAPIARQPERGAHDVRAALEIGDGLEQRNDVHHEPAGRQQSHFFEQDRDFEQIADRLTLGDDVIRQRRRAEMAMDLRRHVHDRKLGIEQRRPGNVRRVEEARIREVGHQQRNALALGERGVIGVDAGARQQLGHDGLVHVGVLAQIERGQMEPEHFDGTTQVP